MRHVVTRSEDPANHAWLAARYTHTLIPSATLEGDPVHNIAGMRPEQITGPWAGAFRPAAQGGCPQIQVQAQTAPAEAPLA
jgi:hypothetical protein